MCFSKNNSVCFFLRVCFFSGVLCGCFFFFSLFKFCEISCEIMFPHDKKLYALLEKNLKQQGQILQRVEELANEVKSLRAQQKDPGKRISTLKCTQRYT